MDRDGDNGVTAVREPADHLRRPPPSVVLLVVLVLPEPEVELAQLREPRQDGQHFVPEKEVQEADAVDTIRRDIIVSPVTGPHVNSER